MSTAMQQGHTNGFAGAMVRPAEGRDVDASIVERVIVAGDLTRLSPAERVSYYVTVCRSVGLNPLTEPFKYIQLNGKLTLYSTKNCTDQLRAIHQVSVANLRRETDASSGVHIVTATVKTPAGRLDEDIGAVSIKGLHGENLANALMKATTKAKRRATLSICGLSFVDESELDAIADAKHVTVDQDGVIIEGPGVVQPEPQRPTVDGGKLMAHWFERIDAAVTPAQLNSIASGVSKAHKDGLVTDEQKDRVAAAVKAMRANLAAQSGTTDGKEPMFDGQAAADKALADLEREPGEEG